jgi:Rad3-related DNA helicase
LLAHVNQITSFGRDIAFQAATDNAVIFWDDDALTLRLISPAHALHEHAWTRSHRRLHMTASFGADPLVWAAHMGLPTTPDKARIIRVPHQFPVQNRTITIEPTHEMNWRAWSDPTKVKDLADKIKELHQRHDAPRTLVHVTSRAQARALQEHIPNAITYTENTRTSNKNTALQEAAKRPHSILIAHSCHRGVDLKDDLCRLNIIAKVPFRSLDRSTRARQAADPAFYSLATAQTLMQATGRAVRSPDDWAYTYVIDAAFSFTSWSGAPVLRQLPDWIREALRP